MACATRSIRAGGFSTILFVKSRSTRKSGELLVSIELPHDLARFRLPNAVNRRLQELLDKQDRGERLTAHERKEAEGLVILAESLSLLKLRTQAAFAGTSRIISG